MYKKVILIPLVLALALGCLAGCGRLKRPQQTDPQAVGTTDGATDATATVDSKEETASSGTIIGDGSAETLGVIEAVGDWNENMGRPNNREESAGSGNQTGTTQPSQSTQPSGGDEQKQLAYEIYLNWPAEKQQEFYRSFEDPDDFFAWLKPAEAEYKKKQEEEGNTIVGGGSLDLKDIIEKFENKN